MNEIDLICCERTGRWAAALRAGLARQTLVSRWEPRIYEVRSLGELAERLETRPLGLVLVEVHLSVLSNLLSWLADRSPHFPRVRFVALLDYTLETEVSDASPSMPGEMQDVVPALLEAGATDVADSPRHMHHIFALAARHSAISSESSRHLNQTQRIVDRAWSQLPWQTEHS